MDGVFLEEALLLEKNVDLVVCTVFMNSSTPETNLHQKVYTILVRAAAVVVLQSCGC